MPKFEKKYVYFMWDSTLEGKTVFFSDYIPDLQQRVENCDVVYSAEVVRGDDDDTPFRMAIIKSRWRFVYYDPYYILKCAHEQGKVIQHFDACNKVWVDATYKLDWTDNVEYYRVKPKEEFVTKLVTKRELAQWLAEGHGQFLDIEYNIAYTVYSYNISEDDTPVPEDTRVRMWGDTAWHVPTYAYMYAEDQE